MGANQVVAGEDVTQNLSWVRYKGCKAVSFTEPGNGHDEGGFHHFGCGLAFSLKLLEQMPPRMAHLVGRAHRHHHISCKKDHGEPWAMRSGTQGRAVWVGCP